VDVGASTGGFTDCLLRRGAAAVYAVDVGYGQLAWPLRSDPRVTVLERTNARALAPALFAVLPDLATVDVSFISLDKILPALGKVLAAPGEVVALVKPQFEAGRGKVGKGGVVRDRTVHREVLEKVLAAARAAGFAVLGLTHSPLKGPAGNIEYFLYLRLQASADPGGAAAPAVSAAAPPLNLDP
jgi:23S rRNA (cytidine1920-2'-O)/16S rRNA (cytidine1409-2'-O)-methyltransferase